VSGEVRGGEAGAVDDVAARRLIGSAPPTSISIPSSSTRAAVSGLLRTSIAPCRSASPRNASISAWLSMMPVVGDHNAAGAGELRLERPRALGRPELQVPHPARGGAPWMACNVATWASPAATTSLPQAAWPTPRSAQ
jgi:hypothetical protein